MKIKNKAMPAAFVSDFEVEARLRRHYLESHPSLPNLKR